jgi:hypothetical protein
VGNELTSIFVAPEFLFVRPRQAADHTGSTAIEEEDRDLALAWAKGISSAYQGMLLIPGTVVFKETLSVATDKGKKRIGRAKENLERAINPARTAIEAGYLPRKQFQIKQGVWPVRNPYETKEYKGDQRFKDLKDQMEGSKAYFQAQIEELTEAEKILANAQPPALQHSFLIKNRVYGFFNGEKVFSVGKKCNMDDYLGDTEKGIFIPGKKTVIQNVCGLKVGFEICMDLTVGILKKIMQATDLDLHIICSASINNEEGNFCTKEGGHVLHACCNPENTAVFRRRGINWDQIEPVPKNGKNVGAGKLTFYEISI